MVAIIYANIIYIFTYIIYIYNFVEQFITTKDLLHQLVGNLVLKGSENLDLVPVIYWFRELGSF